MPLVKKRTDIPFCPRDMLKYFREHKNVWYNLNAGKTVMVPAGEMKNLGRFIEAETKEAEAEKSADVSTEQSKKKSGFLSQSLKNSSSEEKKGNN